MFFLIHRLIRYTALGIQEEDGDTEEGEEDGDEEGETTRLLG